MDEHIWGFLCYYHVLLLLFNVSFQGAMLCFLNNHYFINFLTRTKPKLSAQVLSAFNASSLVLW